jgi:hypothetical protein
MTVWFVLVFARLHVPVRIEYFYFLRCRIDEPHSLQCDWGNLFAASSTQLLKEGLDRAGCEAALSGNLFCPIPYAVIPVLVTGIHSSPLSAK